MKKGENEKKSFKQSLMKAFIRFQPRIGILLGFLIIIGGISLGLLLARSAMPKTNDSLNRKINEALTAHRFGEAYELLGKAIEREPYNTDYYIIQADLLERKGRIDEAITVLNNGLSKVEDQAKVYDKLWQLYKIKGDIEKEVDCLETLLRISLSTNTPLSIKYRYELARAYIDIGRLDDAKSQLSAIVSTNDRSQEAFFLAARDLALWNIEDQTTRDSLLAIASEGSEKVKADVEKIKNVFIKNADEAKKTNDSTKFARYYGWLAGAQLTFDLCPLSHSLFEKSIQEGDRFGIYRDAHKNYGICLYKERSYEKALEQINFALQADPIDLESWIYKANICSAKEDFQCADEAYSKVFTVGTNNAEWYKNYCNYLKKQSRVNEVLECMERLHSLSGSEEERVAVAEDVTKYAILNSVDVLIVEKWLNRIDQNSTSFFIVKGWVHLQKGEVDKAEENIRQAISSDPFDPLAAYYLAVIMKSKGDRNQAIDWATKAIDYDLTGEITDNAVELLKMLNAVV